MTHVILAARCWSLVAAALFAMGFVVSPSLGRASVECLSGWEFGPTLRLLQSDGWSVIVQTSGRGIGGRAIAVPADRRPLLRGLAEGSSDGTAMNFGIGWDSGFETHYSGVVDQASGAVTGQRPDGVTWKSATAMRCVGSPAPDAPLA